MGNKGDLRDFECGVIVAARFSGLSISQTTISRVYTELSSAQQLLMPVENGQCFELRNHS